MQQPTQPPPPPPPGQKRLSGFHCPETNLFPGIRQQLTILDRFSPPLGAGSTALSFLVASVFAALASMGLSYVVELLFLVLVGPILTVAVFAPMLEEPFKALGMLVVIYFMWKTVPNRRYGAALGAAAGLGFGISESVVYLASTPTLETFLSRVVVTCMHPLWSAFIGIGLFAMFSGKNVPKGIPNRSGFVAMALFLVGLANHIVWNSLALLGLLGFLLDVFLIFPIFAVVLRDFLGGHFDFQDFFEPSEKPAPSYSGIPPPPPPPQYPQQAPTAQEVVKERQVIVKIKCSYCGKLYDETLVRCPNCGAKN